jgi:monoamine oxidase
MARSGVFRRLKRLFQLSWVAERNGLSLEALRQERRAFLQQAGALMLGGPLLVAAGCGEEATASRAQEVAIIGGGMAGLHCAYRLKLGGVQATIYEASDRIGGRMFSLRGEFADGQVAELGGELIDTGHETIRALAEELGVALDDLFADEPEGFRRELFFFDGAVVPEEEIVASFLPLAEKMAAQLALAEADDAEFERIDQLSIPQWLEEAGADGLIRTILETAYVGEYGLEVEEQSVLNLLYLIDFDEPDPFRIYGDSDERFHAHTGNDALTTRLSERLDAAQLQTGHKLVEVVSGAGGRVMLRFERGGESVSRVVDRVVFALPFTTLREVDLSRAGLSERKREVITALGYGTNAKLMMGFSEPVWRTRHSASGSTTTDNGLQTLWDTARGQEGAAGLLTQFVGGARGLSIGDGTPESQAEAALPLIEPIYPGAQGAYTAGSAVRMHWPTAPHQKGSYACYRPGQWSFFGEEGRAEGVMYFCGEHCSEDFQGYMEGAAETGAKVAAALLGDLGLDARQGMLRVTDRALSALPSACYHGGARRLRPTQRRRLRRAQRPNGA